MNYQALANLLFPDVTETPEDLEKKYPARNLPEHAVVTRIGPSPTGFVHLGNLYNAVIGERLAHQSNGVFYLRIEDTDNKRKVDGAVETLIHAMNYFNVHFDEGAIENHQNNGMYAPYYQRQRKNIYHVIAKYLTEQGKTYPCFLTPEELDAIREQQTANKEDIGIYGKYAFANRNLSLEQIQENINGGKSWVLRFKAEDTQELICVEDAIRGKLEMPRNFMDFVLLKSDGIPTYHFAHVVDDYFMHSTHIIRGEEWISSLPMHVELFNILHWKQPIYCHTATLMKIEDGKKRKLSKRKDPELALAYYQQEGICQDAVWEFLLTVLNSNFEEWRLANPELSYLDFEYSISKMSISGALVDLDKLKDISKEVLSRMPAEKLYSGWLDWCKQYDLEFAKLLETYPERTINALNVGRTAKKPRKDLENWKQACEFMRFYYQESFVLQDAMPEEIDEETRKLCFKLYLENYNHEDDSATWFAKVKALTEQLGCAVKPKDYKKNPDQYKGSIIHVTNMLRIALTGRANAPDIWEVSHVLGEEIVRNRLEKWL
ncbi:MAG: glutamate--tRNA ligase [Oscillospiraceae bacterium]|nr:glutamate--tRNA ligase [Oscillospiraceae bacterium]